MATSTLLDLPCGDYLTHPHPGPPLPSPLRRGKGRVREGLGEVKKPEFNIVELPYLVKSAKVLTVNKEQNHGM
jgi:hypothetical protein